MKNADLFDLSQYSEFSLQDNYDHQFMSGVQLINYGILQDVYNFQSTDPRHETELVYMKASKNFAKRLYKNQVKY